MKIYTNHICAVLLFLLSLIDTCLSTNLKGPTPPKICSKLLCGTYCGLLKFQLGICVKENRKTVCKCKCSLANICLSKTLCNKACNKKGKNGVCYKDADGCNVCSCCPASTCQGNSDCSQDAYCDSTSDSKGCTYNTCKSCPAAECTSQSGCNSDEYCATGTDNNGCSTGSCEACPSSTCNSNGDCNSGEYCDSESDNNGCNFNTCKSCPATECTSTDQCGSNQVCQTSVSNNGCITGTCVNSCPAPQCSTNSDCGDNRACRITTDGSGCPVGTCLQCEARQCVVGNNPTGCAPGLFCANTFSSIPECRSYARCNCINISDQRACLNNGDCRVAYPNCVFPTVQTCSRGICMA